MARKLTIASCLAIALALSVQAHAADFTLRIHHFLGDESLPHTALIEPWARRVEADSNGRIEVEIHPKMGLGGKTQELVDQVRDGTVDIVWTAAAYTPNQFPHAEVFTLPSVHDGDPAATNQAMISAMDGFLQPDFRDFKPLLAHVQAGHSLHMSRTPVTRVSDLDGLVLRPAGRRIGIWMLDALGAKPSRKRHPKLST
ncbi:MAG: C4-dicarboxylate ABC transporter substrate-binding protein, partial [Gammaproteobacteria bacterium]|nr:C4-dicarboxylate ABC transporter substrate-binding protein [Gammaproteobacteria bacterium]